MVGTIKPRDRVTAPRTETATTAPVSNASVATQSEPASSTSSDGFSTGGQLSNQDMPVTNPGATGSSPLAVRLSSATRSSEASQLLDQISAMQKGPTDAKEEARILDLLKNASPRAFDEVIAALDIHELAEDFDSRVVGLDGRSALFDLIGHERLSALSLTTRAHVIHGVQEGRTDNLRERLIRDILVGTKGEELTGLKNAIDTTGDHHDLVGLVFKEIDDRGLREQILTHFASEAASVHPAHPKVLSDIDDTLYANLKDQRYPKKTMYPGVRAFYKAMSGYSPSTERPAPAVTFLTARPDEGTGLVEDYSRHSLSKMGVPSPSVISGSFTHLFGNDKIADKKKQNLSLFAQVYPEYENVFVGDSGQGDRQVDETRATFIHRVTEMSEGEVAELKSRGVFVFDTYVGAAVKAHELGLVDNAGLKSVMDEAKQELSRIAFDDPSQKAAREAELARDVEAASALLLAS